MNVETFIWIDPDGTHYDFDDDRITVMEGVEGRFMPPIELVEQTIPGQPGALLRSVKTLVREIALPVVFQADDADDLRDLLRDWAYRFSPSRGDGTLRVRGPDGHSRQILCRYSDGLTMVEAGDTHVGGWQKAVVVFRAQDPYWQATADARYSFTGGGGETSMFFPFFPLRLNSDLVFEDLDVRNDGDVDAWPVWEIHGPADDPIVLKNLTTDQEIRIHYDLASFETLLIDTRPGYKTVMLDDGTNLYGDLDGDSVLWPLVINRNAVRAELAATDPSTSIVLTFRERFLTV